jgi:hypothetical protein
VQIPINDLTSWRLDEPLPSPADQLDELILLVGDNQPSPGECSVLKSLFVSSWIGLAIAKPPHDVPLVWLLRQQMTAEFFEKYLSGGSPDVTLQLNMRGWSRYETLKQRRIESRKVIMAMKFGDRELNEVVSSCFAPAVKRAGFELRTIADGQPAGLIDDQLRVALRTSRFVVADLTHRNNGAYWEAGFAEGLGRPVIYTCRETEWAGGGSHFDTNHLVTVIWNPANLPKAGEQLTATIRATLPEEAVMSD